MGVAGAGKSTVGAALADALGWTFIDADDFHTAENIERIRSGVGLTDEDRAPWLARVRDAMLAAVEASRPAVVACSALKHRYRYALAHGIADVHFVYLRASEALLRYRLATRPGHFAGPAIAAAQAHALEPPDGHEALTLDASASPGELVDAIRRELHL